MELRQEEARTACSVPMAGLLPGCSFPEGWMPSQCWSAPCALNGRPTAPKGQAFLSRLRSRWVLRWQPPSEKRLLEPYPSLLWQL